MGDIRKIVILGSTGSIGQQTLDVVRAFSHRFEVVGLAGGRNVELLVQQIDEFRPRVFFSLAGDEIGCEGKFLSMEEMSCLPEVDIVVVATSGIAGLSSTLSAIRADKTVALANKEVLVTAGEIVSREAMIHGVSILPLDSEHNAIWQCLQGENSGIYQVILTASGGPFYDYSCSQMETVTVDQALRHPTWKMGKKVTIDSATLMNKGLEVIEAHWLFKVPFERIKVLVHRQSIIHSMIEFADGSVKAQLGVPDMRLPIQYALMSPHRLSNDRLLHLDWTKMYALTLEDMAYDKFPCLKLALDAGKKGGTYPSVLCAADEIATDLFMNRRVGFNDIARIIQMTLERHRGVAHPSMEEILAADAWARKYAASAIEFL
jgi:1-deoxy-D-xylulose-5-phosphate reductoisomerase